MTMAINHARGLPLSSFYRKASEVTGYVRQSRVNQPHLESLEEADANKKDKFKFELRVRI